MNRQDAHGQILEWSRQGSKAELTQEQQAHLASCEECASYVRRVQLAREVGQELPHRSMSRADHDAIKQALMTEARRTTGEVRLRRGHGRKMARWSAVSFLVATAAAAATAWVLRGTAPPTPIGPQGPSGRKAVEMSVPTRAGDATGAPNLREAGENSADDGREPGANAPPPAPEPARQLAPSPSSSARPSATTLGNEGDEAFVQAWSDLRSNRPGQAAREFDAILEHASLDPARRLDVLYWSAQAHRRAGNGTAARTRALRLLNDYPSSALAYNAALMLGEMALERKQYQEAKPYLERARTATHPLVRARAERGMLTLEQAGQKQPAGE